MNLFFRLIWLLLTQWRKPRLKFFDLARTDFRVLPSDLDTNLHMNNGVYLSLMDLARTDLVLRTGLFRVVKEKGWYPVVASQKIRYRHSLGPFQKFTIHTRLIGWDERFFFLQQEFRQGPKLCAWAVVKARFMKKSGGGVNPGEFAASVGESATSPELPAWVRQWTDAEDAGWAESVEAK